MPEWPSSLPDSELIVVKTIEHYLDILFAGAVQVLTDVPRNWNEKMTYVVVERVSGASSRKGPGLQHRIDHAVFSVMVFAGRKNTASQVARLVSFLLHKAVLDRYEVEGVDGGLITKFQETKGPVRVRDGVTGKHADAAMYDATYTLWLRGHYE